MSAWMQVILSLCAVATTAALVLLLLAARRSVQRTDVLVTTIEREISPMVARLQSLIDELSALVRQVNLEMSRVGLLTERVIDLSDGVGRVLSAVGGFTRVGQLVGVATGVKRGVEVFLQRIRN